MSRRIAIEPEFERRLATVSAGAQTVQLLLDEVPPDRTLRTLGRWTALFKPGLGHRERWRWELPTGDTYYVKRYLATPPREQLDRILRQSPWHSRAWWEYDQSHRLLLRGIPAVRAVAAAEIMCGPWERRSAVVFEKARGDALDRVWARLAAICPPIVAGAARHALTRDLAGLAAAFHKGGDCHRDLYLCHVFADLGGTHGPAGALTLIDLARTFRPRWRPARWIVKDLSQLDASARQLGLHRTDRLRFLEAYTGLRSNAPRLRGLATRVLRRSAAILRRDARKRGVR